VEEVSVENPSEEDRSGHPDLAAEQAYLDRAHHLIEQMLERTRTTRQASDRIVDAEGTVDAQVANYHLRRREERLGTGSGPLCFGRIDTDDGQRWYVGRRHVEDADANPVVVDWRAGVASGFYRATVVDPCGVDLRRRYGFGSSGSAGGHATQQAASGPDCLVSIFDEDLTDPDGSGASGLPDPLLAELDRARSGQMRDIASTIAAEQDEIIRAPLGELVVVQGGPGTGKTAVGLHRAAFLLFNERETLADSHVLVLGPNRLFLRYIADVLPSLGETTVRQTTVAGLLAAKYRVRGDDDRAAARIKGDRRMAAVIEAAIRQRIKVPASGVEVRSGLNVVRFEHDDVEQLVKTILGGGLPVSEGRAQLRRLLIAEAWRRYVERVGIDDGTQVAFESAVRSDRDLKATVDKIWPNFSAAAVLRGLYGSPRRLAAAADGVLDETEQALLRRPSAKKADDERWTEADLPLLDEAEARISGVPLRYGHVVVDEAQDLSAMALRLIGRRALGGSMTILGDLAQATSPHALGSWEEALRSLRSDNPDVQVRMTELTVGYRVPAAILDVANRLLPTVAPGVSPARSVRPGGEPPLLLSCDDRDLVATVAAEVAELVDRFSSVAVVAQAETLDRLHDPLAARGITADRVGGRGLPGRDAVALVSPAAVKGLEFDAVVVVEPADIAALEHGLRHLFVSLTRSVQHLGVVHAKPLPEPMVAST
jgi:DNA helicase IV